MHTSLLCRASASAHPLCNVSVNVNNGWVGAEPVGGWRNAYGMSLRGKGEGWMHAGGGGAWQPGRGAAWGEGE